MDFAIHALEQSFLALGFVLLVLFLQSLMEEIVIPRLSFSKTSAGNLRQMMIRWILFARRFDFEFKRDVLMILKISCLLTAVAILPLNGESGLEVDRPDLAVAQIMAIFYFLRVWSAWRSSSSANWEKGLEEILFASSRVFIFLLLIDGAYLAAEPGEFQKMLGQNFLIVTAPLHAIGFLLGILFVGFFQGRQEYKKNLTGLSLFAWKAEPILWVTLLLITFLNFAEPAGIVFFVVLAAKCTLIVFGLELVRSHMPKMRMDQVERVGLTVIYPIAIIIFLAMWWQEVR